LNFVTWDLGQSVNGRFLREIGFGNSVTFNSSSEFLVELFMSPHMGLAASVPLCFAQEDHNSSHETAIIPVTAIAAVSATVAVIGVVIARTSAGAAMKSAFVPPVEFTVLLSVVEAGSKPRV
jgi:hypothetical protein